MPGFVKTKKGEEKWSKAKEASGKETAPESKGYWKLANYIFHKMKKHQELEKFEKLKNELLKSLNMKKAEWSTKPFGGDSTHHLEHQGHKIKITPGNQGGHRIDHTPPKGDSASYHVSGAIHHAKGHAESLVGIHKAEDIEKAEKLEKDLMGLMRSDPTKVPNPMKAGEQTVTSKTPKALKISNPLDKPSVFFKSESGSHELKHVNMCKLNDFMKKCRK